MLAPQDEVIADSEDDESYYPLETSKSFADVSSVRKVGGLSMRAYHLLGRPWYILA
jgi:hypothetical protein